MSELIAMLLCIVANGFLALAEMAFVAVGKRHLKELSRTGNANARRLLELRDKPERTLSVLQIGITLFGAVAAATGGVGMEEAVSPYLENELGLSERIAEVVGIALLVVPFTYLSVVAGELVPKTLALRNPLRVALASAKWLVLADKIFMPAVNILEWSTKKLLCVIAPRSKTETSESAENVLDIDYLSPLHRQYVFNLVNIENKRIRDIYSPLKNVVSASINDSTEQIRLLFIESAYTRFPVFKNGEVKGILHSKEFMALQASGRADWRELLRPVLVVKPKESLLKVLRMIQDGKTQMVIVQEKNEVLGIVTLEDIIEEIIGEIFDEDEEGAVKHVLSTKASLRRPNDNN
ncbi:MAG: hemolysin [Deltaproteobacteria bacterium CG11_big_fil_rev_8_21_14_0_20_42_23]|nr:MAG: hemolysin [Deltaproteobacteria bacterium CG11_big_fil_rev_8_21_14_0_20_42_23]PJC63417.1 MAG: HlyC/CorC family transporter [Deltaproteobacteria bacterium CG_4_9_14_0_2_um_filter_42_21]